MKKIILLTLLSASLLSYAQTNFNLEIRHTLDGVNSVMNTTETNSMNDDFEITRLQYYITRISVIHDGNQITSIDDSVAVLVNVDNELVTTIPLGLQNISLVEGVKFHIGVYSPVNNEDPTLWPSQHPFAPQNPSMHWGWASGYRFIAFEGVAGTNFSQLWQFHGLGNANYFEVNQIITSSVDVSGIQTIKVDADYIEALKGIELSQGIISHGETGEAIDVLQNFKNFVFTAPGTASVKEAQSEIKFSVLNNPSIAGVSYVKYESELEGQTLKVYSATGQEVSSMVLDGSGSQKITTEEKGIYFITLIGTDGVKNTRKLIHN